MAGKRYSQKFVISLLAVFISSFIFIMTNKLAGTEYAAILIAVVGLYNGSNVYQKKVLGE